MALEGISSHNLRMVSFRASISSILLIAQALRCPCHPITGFRWQSTQRAMQVYCKPCLKWWASLGGGASQTEQGRFLTLAKCNLSFALSLLFIGLLLFHA